MAEQSSPDETRPTPPAAPVDPARFGFAPGACAVVTGGASGIGRAAAIALARVGVRVAIWDVDLDGANATADAARVAGAATVAGAGEPVVVHGDVFDDAAVAQAWTATCDALESVPAHLVDNAGPRAADPRPFLDGLTLGVGAMHRVCDQWLTLGPPPGASAVFTASVAGNVTGAEPAWYASAKAALVGYVRSLAITVAPAVRVNAVGPSLVATPRMATWMASDQGRRWRDENPMRRWAEADDVAWPIVFLLSPLAGYVNGVLLPIDGGQTLIL